MALTDVDRDLCARCLTQDPVAWREFVDRFAGLFAHVVRHTAQARSVSLSTSDVDDLVADMFLTVVVDDMAVLRRYQKLISRYEAAPTNAQPTTSSARLPASTSSSIEKTKKLR